MSLALFFLDFSIGTVTTVAMLAWKIFVGSIMLLYTFVSWNTIFYSVY